jgi:hypothetical protein
MTLTVYPTGRFDPAMTVSTLLVKNHKPTAIPPAWSAPLQEGKSVNALWTSAHASIAQTQSVACI